MSAKNVLFVFKDRKSVTLNNDFWSEKFKNKYKVTQFFINDFLYLSNKKIISEINKIISSNDIEIVLLEGDHAHIIDYNFIKSLNNKTKKGIFLGDDMVWHNLNAISAQSCDFIFSSCPISALKFQEIGTNSFFVPIESDGKILKDYKLEKIYDVLHFGREKTIRSNYIDYLKNNNIKVKSVSPYDNEADTFEKLAKLINQSKIILNFSESTNGTRKFNQLRIFKKFYQLKGRIQMAGLANSLCISQYSPSINLMYKHNELPVFNNKEECLEKVKLYLNDKNLLKVATDKFHEKTLEYEDSRYIEKIGSFLDSISIKEKELFKTPIWYNQIFINQSIRLRFKRVLMKAFFQEFINNVFNLKDKNIFTQFHQFFFSIAIFLRYLPFLLLKFILRIFKK
jgi:hypothetical protein